MSSARTGDPTLRSAPVAELFDAPIQAPIQVALCEPQLELKLAAKRESLSVINEVFERFLAAELARCRCPSLLQDVLLALQEASSNVVRHAYRDQSEPGAIIVNVEVLPHLLRLAVMDEGPGYDPSCVPTPDFSHPRDGGFGLHLMRATMSKVAYARRGGRNVLLMEKALVAEAGERAA